MLYWSAITAIIWGEPMLRTKTADRIVCFTAAVMLIVSVCIWGVVEAVKGNGSHEVGYESLLFDSSRVHTIEITADNWRIFAAELDLLDIPGMQNIIDGWERQFSQPMMQQESTGGGGADMVQQGIPGAQNLPLLGGVPT